MAYEEPHVSAHGSQDTATVNTDAGCPVIISESADTGEHVCSFELMTWAVDQSLCVESDSFMEPLAYKMAGNFIVSSESP